MKRFTNDIIRILKNKPQRSMLISEIPIEYGRYYSNDRFEWETNLFLF